MNKNNLKRVRVLWQDAISYRTGDKIPDSTSALETTGLLAKEDSNYVVIEKPTTINTRTSENYPDKTPTFYFIPRGMIEKIEIV